MRQKHLLLFVILSLFATSLSACGDSSPILIGYSGQLTGKISDLGVFGRNGALLAIERINASGGINNRPLQLIAVDDENTPEGAIEADKILTDKGVVAIIGHMTSSQTMAAMPFINENGTVVVSPTTSTPQLTGKTDSFFRVMVENSRQSEELAKYARSALDVKTAVTIAETDNDSYTSSFTNVFIRTFQQAGGEILDKLSYSSSKTTGWDLIIDTLISLEPDAVLLSCPAQDAVKLVQRLRTVGLKTRILSGAWAYTESLLQWGGQFVEGMIFVIDFAADNPKPEYVIFREAYRNRFGTDPNFASAFSYEAVMALEKGLIKTNGSSSGLAEAMAPSDTISGVIGEFSLDEYGDVERSVFVVTVQEGEFRTVEMK